MNIRPLHDRILVQRITQADKTASGLFIPDNAKEKPLEAKVMAVGPGKRLDDGQRQAVDILVGDTVLIGKYTGAEVRVDGVDHLILHEDDVLAVLGKAGS